MKQELNLNLNGLTLSPEELDLNLNELDLNNLNLDFDKINLKLLPLENISTKNVFKLFIRRYPFMSVFEKNYMMSHIDKFLTIDKFIVTKNNSIINVGDLNHRSILFFWVYGYVLIDYMFIRKDKVLIQKINEILYEFLNVIDNVLIQKLFYLIN